MLQAASIAVKVTESNALDISKNIKCINMCFVVHKFQGVYALREWVV